MQSNRLPPLNSLKAFEAAGRHQSFLEAAGSRSRSVWARLRTRVAVRGSHGECPLTCEVR